MTRSGVGNVALDVARILLRPASELAGTDVTAAALAALQRSSIQCVARDCEPCDSHRDRQVRVVGRRSIAQAAFTTKELRELTAIPNCKIVVDPAAFELNAASKVRRHSVACECGLRT